MTKWALNGTISHMEKLYLISQAAQILGVAVKTLQKWDREGKLVAQRTSAGNRRVYTETQLRSHLEARQEAGRKSRTVPLGLPAPTEDTRSSTEEQKERVYTIAQASKLLGLSIKTLQRWDRVGILTALRTGSNRRIYTEAQLKGVIARGQQEESTDNNE